TAVAIDRQAVDRRAFQQKRHDLGFMENARDQLAVFQVVGGEGESLSMVSTRLNPRSGIFRLFRWKPSRRNCSAKENPLIIPG
ncbi:hypothetical protein DP140_27290, partial [Salmonella enterica subsp. enterica serovar Weltevreden]